MFYREFISDVKLAQFVQILYDRWSKQEIRLDLHNFGVKLDHRVYNPVFVGLLYVLVKIFHSNIAHLHPRNVVCCQFQVRMKMLYFHEYY